MATEHVEEKVSLTSLSSEQLIDYIKHQKVKISKLTTEKDSLKAQLDIKQRELQEGNILVPNDSAVSLPVTITSNERPDLVFWGLIDRQPEWQKKIARSAISSMIIALRDYFYRLHPAITLHGAYDKWKSYATQKRLHQSTVSLEEAHKVNMGLEQRVVKLKSLLSRTYQANQRTIEDTDSMKRAQQEVVEELRNLKLREEDEKRTLEESLRQQSVESAFHYDMELIIQRAADGVISNQGTWAQSQFFTLKKLRELESENEDLKATINQQTKEADKARISIEDLSLELSRLRVEKQEIGISHASLVEDSTRLRRQLLDEQTAKRDLEVEVEILVSARSAILTSVESELTQKADHRVSDLNDQITLLKAQVETAEKKARISEITAAKMSAECSVVRETSKALVQSQTEVSQLQELVAELKRSLAMAYPLPPSTPGTFYSSQHPSILAPIQSPSDINASNTHYGHDGIFSLFTPTKANPIRSLTAIPTDLGRLVTSSGSSTSNTTSVTTSGVGGGEGIQLNDMIHLTGGQLALDELVNTALSTAEENYTLIRSLEREGRNHIGDVETRLLEFKYRAILDWGETLLFMVSRCMGPFFDISTQTTIPTTNLVLIPPSNTSIDVNIQQLLVSLGIPSILRNKVGISDLGHRLSDRREVLKKEVTHLRATDPSAMSMTWEAASVAVQAGKDLVLTIHIPNTERLAFLEWQYSADVSDFINLKLVRPRWPTGATVGNDQSGMGEGLLLQSEVSIVEEPNLPVYSGAVALRGGGDQLLHICNSAMWGTVNIAYVIRLRFDGAEIHETRLRVAEEELAVAEQDLLKLRIAVSRGKALSRRAVAISTAWRLALTGQLSLSSNDVQGMQSEVLFVDERRVQRSERQKRLLQEAKQQLRKLKGLARNAIKVIEPLSLGKVTGLGKQQSIENGAEDATSTAPPAVFLPGIASPAPKPASQESNSEAQNETCSAGDKSGSAEPTVIHSAASITIRAASDLRMIILGPPSGIGRKKYLIRWDWAVLSPAGTDLGFSLLEKLPSGFLKQLVPYRRSKWGGGPVGADVGGHVEVWRSPDLAECNPILLLLDNSYSWLTPKIVRYCVTVQLVASQLHSHNKESSEDVLVPVSEPDAPSDRVDEAEVLSTSTAVDQPYNLTESDVEVPPMPSPTLEQPVTESIASATNATVVEDESVHETVDVDNDAFESDDEDDEEDLARLVDSNARNSAGGQGLAAAVRQMTALAEDFAILTRDTVEFALQHGATLLLEEENDAANNSDMLGADGDVEDVEEDSPADVTAATSAISTPPPVEVVGEAVVSSETMTLENPSFLTSIEHNENISSSITVTNLIEENTLRS